ncbi:hypothetical protein [Paenibacillus sp. FSL H8-0332]|uniref:hypothetical protein n=1 Tax=Paenibacillus sp. FSL H8-0332 TaxID=2954742 RepID=UPI0030CAEFB6
MENKHIVFILGNYYPNYSANGLCVKNIIDFLKLKYQVTVICEKSEYIQNELEVYDGQSIIRIETKDIKKRNENRFLLRNEKKLLKKKVIYSHVFFNRTFRYLSALLKKENIEYNSVNKFVLALANLEKKIDIIIPVCFPYESVVAALTYKKNIDNSTDIVPYLFDKFSISNTLHRTKWNLKIKFKKHLALEKWMMDSSTKIIATSDWQGHIEKYFSDYSRKIYISEIPSLKPIDEISTGKFADNKIHFVYAGSLNHNMRSPKYTLELFSLCMEENSDYVLHMYIVGNCEGLVDQFVNKHPQQIINYGSVETKIAHQALKSADFLLSIGNIDITQKPSKVYEYMSCGKPIIHLYNDHNDPVIDILSKYPYSCCINQNKLLLEENKREIMNFVKQYSMIPPLDFSEVRKLFYEATPEFVSEKIVELLDIK